MKSRKKSSTSYPILFLMVDATDHITGKTGLTPTVTISKNGAAFASPSGAVTELSSGWYALAGNATDRNTLGEFLIHATGTGADPFDDKFVITEFDPFDTVRAGLTALPNAAADAAGGLPISDAGGLDLDTQLGKLVGTLASGTHNPQSGDAYAIVNSGTFGNSALKTLIDAIDDFIDTEVAAIKAKTDNLPSDPADASDIAAAFSTVNSTLTTIAAYIDTEVAAIKAKTDNLPSDPADASDIAASFSSLASTLSTIAGYIDTEVAAIKAKTDQLTFGTANRVDAQVFGMENNTITANAIAANAIDADALAADAVAEINATGNPAILQSTTIAAMTSQLRFTLTAGSADDKAYEGCIVIVTDSSTSTQKATGVVLQYTGSTKTVRLAFDPGVFTMAVGDSISIMAAHETPEIHAELSVKSTAGSTAQLTAWMEVAGKKVPIATIDASATCSISVREHGTGVDLFTTAGVAADITNSMFEVEQANPNFADDRQYELTATITLNSVAYSTTHSRVVIG